MMKNRGAFYLDKIKASLSKPLMTREQLAQYAVTRSMFKQRGGGQA